MKNLAIFLSLSSIIFAADSTFKSTSPVKNVMLAVASSNLTVEGYEGNTVEITHNLGDKIKFVEEEGILKSQSDDKFSLDSLTNMFKKSEETYVKVKVPKDTTLVLGSTSGDVKVSGINANVAVATTSGDATISNLTSTLEIATTSGVTLVDGVKGVFLYSGTSGNLGFKNVDTIGNITTTSGNITGDIKNVTTSKVSSVSGKVTLTLVSGGNYSFYAKSNSGKVAISSPHIKTTSTGSEILGTVGNGNDGKLEVKTSSGDLTVR